MASSNGNIFRVTVHLCGEFTGHRWIPRTKASDGELWWFFMCARIKSWVNNGEAGDLRHHRTLWRHCNIVTKTIVVYGKPNIILYLLIQQHLPDTCKFTRNLLKNIIGITRRVYGHFSIHIFLNDRFGIVCRLFTKCSVFIDSTFILQSYVELWRHIFILPQKVLRDILNFIT